MKNKAMAKDAYIGIRTTLEVKKMLEKLAEEDYRTLSQHCEMVLVKWLESKGHLKKKSKK